MRREELTIPFSIKIMQQFFSLPRCQIFLHVPNILYDWIGALIVLVLITDWVDAAIFRVFITYLAFFSNVKIWFSVAIVRVFITY